jgi:fructokinase
VQLVVITRGANGLVGVTADGVVEVPGVKVIVVDTVGAGDTVGAIIVEAVVQRGILNLTGLNLKEVLHRAAVAAAITCSRAGAQPPRAFELTEALERN